MNAFINVRLNFRWTIDKKTGAGSIHETCKEKKNKKKTVCVSEALPNWLIPFAPRKSLTQISKENVRLFCSCSVICLTKRLSFTSGDVSCRLCHTDLLSADVLLLSTQLLPGQFIPSLFALLKHTFAIFSFLLWAAAEQLSPRLKYLSSSHGFYTRHQIPPQYLLSDKRHFLRKGSFLPRSLLMRCVPGISSGLSVPVWDIDEIKSRNDNNF